MRAIKRANFASGSNSNRSAPMSLPKASTQTKNNVTDIEHSYTAILTYTQQILSSEQISQLAASTKQSIIHRVKYSVSRIISQAQQQLPAKLGINSHTLALIKSKQNSHRLTSELQQSSKNLATAYSSSIQERTDSNLFKHGTTLASSLKTRQLVLVNADNRIFTIFTPKQQADLQHYISRIIFAYQQSRMVMPRRTKQLSAKSILAIGAAFIAALPVEFRKAWSQIAMDRPRLILPPIAANRSSAQPRTRVFYPVSRIVHTGQISSSVRPHKLSSSDFNVIETNINNVRYVEHPLEKILRLLDRVLTWCEHRWQQWIERNANMG